MLNELKARVIDMLVRPRPIRPQTERQLPQFLAEHTDNLNVFFLGASELLEEYELDLLFAPHFTPTFDDSVEVSDLLYHWRPTEPELDQLTRQIFAEAPPAIVQMSDGTDVQLTLHEVMVERFIRLLRLTHAADSESAASLRDALPAGLWPVAMALVRQRGFTPAKQQWVADFVNHAAGRHEVTQRFLVLLCEFIAAQQTLASEPLAQAISATVAAHRDSVTRVSSGHAYWSPDVAQHHHYRGQGDVDEHRVAEAQQDLDAALLIEKDLAAYGREAEPQG